MQRLVIAIALAALAIAIATLFVARSAAAATPAAIHAVASPRAPGAVSLPAPATPVPVAPTAAVRPSQGLAIVTADHSSLRAAPRGSAQQQAMLWQGEVLEVRGERLDYLQVYDHKRERGGYVHQSLVRRTSLAPAEAPELLSVIRFIRDTPGAEALGIGLSAAYLKAAPAEVLNGSAGIEAFDALGTFADRLARRASSGSWQDKAAAAVISAHLEVAARYGIGFTSFETDGRMRICYEGEAFRRVLALASSPEQRARAALAITSHECVNPDLRPAELLRLDTWRAEVLDRADTAGLPAYLKNRLQIRRAGVWASLAFQRARQDGNTGAAAAAATRALTELAGVTKTELPESDGAGYSDAAMRVNASRWAALPGPAPVAAGAKQPVLLTLPGQPGETCVLLLDAASAARNDTRNPLVRRCTYGLVWAGAASTNREGTALSVAVQPLPAWRELWVFTKGPEGWNVGVLPPATTNPEVGYAEFAGWVPGGAQMLVAREAHGEGKTQRAFEVIRLDNLATERQVAEPGMLSTFQRWQDPNWKRMTLSVR